MPESGEKNTGSEKKRKIFLGRNFLIILIAVFILCVPMWLCKLISGAFGSKTTITSIMSNGNTFVEKVNDLVLCKSTTTEEENREEVVQRLKYFYSKAIYKVRFKVTYFYKLKMSSKGDWAYELKDGILYVTAPPIDIMKPPGIHTDSIEAQYEGGWLVTNEKKKLAQLVKEITPMASQRGMNEKRLSVVIPHCRESLVNFIENRLSESGKNEVKAIKVIFANEKHKVSLPESSTSYTPENLK